MNRDEARRAFIAGVRNASKLDHEGAFVEWWGRQTQDSYTMLAGLAPAGPTFPGWVTGQRFRWMIPASKPSAVIAVACAPDDPEWVGVFLEEQGYKDPETGYPCGLVRVERDREKVAIDTETHGEWWLDPNVGVPYFPKRDSETAMERGTAIHKEIESNLATTFTNGRAAYRCENQACPERAPVRADSAPKCYTCDRPMRLVAQAGDLLLSRNGELLEDTTAIGDLAKEIIRRMLPSLPPLKFDKLVTAEPKLMREWYDARRAWRDNLKIRGTYGSQLLASYVPICREPGETDAELRERIRAQPARPRELDLAEHIVEMHPDVVKVTARVDHMLHDPQIYVEAVVKDGCITNAMQRALGSELDRVLPAATDWRLDLTYDRGDAGKHLGAPTLARYSPHREF